MTSSNFITSDYSLESCLKDALASHWIKAGCAHLTTYLDAQKKGLQFFWNIDADDTEFFASANSVSKLFYDVENYVKENDLDAMSLDMWYSNSKARHWTFGVSFHKTNTELWSALRENGEKYHDWFAKKVNRENIRNLDWMFTFLRNEQILKLQTFCVMDSFFIHWCFKPNQNPSWLGGTIHWHEDYCDYPLFPLSYEIPVPIVRFRLQENINALSLKLAENCMALQENIKKLKDEIVAKEELNKKINSNNLELKQNLNKLEKQLNDIKNSETFKLGKAILLIPRAIKLLILKSKRGGRSA